MLGTHRQARTKPLPSGSLYLNLNGVRQQTDKYIISCWLISSPKEWRSGIENDGFVRRCTCCLEKAVMAGSFQMVLRIPSSWYLHPCKSWTYWLTSNKQNRAEVMGCPSEIRHKKTVASILSFLSWIPWSGRSHEPRHEAVTRESAWRWVIP